MISPVRISREARARPARANRRCVPPAPGIRPRLVSGRPSLAVSPNTRQSAISASSNPPPSAKPSTAAISGLGKPRIAAQCALRGSSGPFGAGLVFDLGDVGPGGKIALGAVDQRHPDARDRRQYRASAPANAARVAVFRAFFACGRFRVSSTQAPCGVINRFSMPALCTDATKFQVRNFKLEIVFIRCHADLNAHIGGMAMKVLCLGGGPAGLYFAISMKLRDPNHQVTVLERNRANDTFGWGVVLSDDALGRMQKNDPVSTEAIRGNFAYWDDIAVVHNGVRTVSGGHGFAGIGRKAMLVLLQARARELGVDLQFETEFKSAEEYRKDYDIVVATDGINSLVRREYARGVPARYRRAQVQVRLAGHACRNSTTPSPSSSRRPNMAGSGRMSISSTTTPRPSSSNACPTPGIAGASSTMSKEETVETCRKIFERHLGGHELMSNAAHLRGSAVWMQFPRVICGQWYHENVVLMGDAAATGHFSIGSGSRLAFDSAIALAEYLHSEPTLEAAFERYQAERRVEVLRLQSAARNSLEWFEEVERYLDMPPHPVRLFPADPQSADQPRKPAPARSEMAARGRGLVSGTIRRQAGAHADVRAVPAARHERWKTASSSRPWRNTRRWMACRAIGISSITPNAPRAGQGWSIPR